MFAFSVDTSEQTTPPLVDGVVRYRLVQFAPHGDQTPAQLVDVLDYAVVHTLHALFCTLFSGFGSAKIIEICYDLTVKCTLLPFDEAQQKCRF